MGNGNSFCIKSNINLSLNDITLYESDDLDLTLATGNMQNTRAGTHVMGNHKTKIKKSASPHSIVTKL